MIDETLFKVNTRVVKNHMEESGAAATPRIFVERGGWAIRCTLTLKGRFPRISPIAAHSDDRLGAARTRA
jgi:hypothetical protein